MSLAQRGRLRRVSLFYLISFAIKNPISNLGLLFLIPVKYHLIVQPSRWPEKRPVKSKKKLCSLI
jgi:hypothetical protein